MQTLNGALGTLTQTLDFLVGLDPAERKRLAKMGPKSRAFVEDTIAAGIRNTEMLPRAVEPEALRGRLELVEQIREMAAAVGQLKERLDDTVTLAGSELYDAARLLYSLTRRSVSADGLTGATEKLSQRFAGQKRKKAVRGTSPEPGTPTTPEQ